MTTIPTTQRAAVYYGARNVRVERRIVPAAARGEALIRVLRSGICGTDATEWHAGPLLFPVHRVSQKTRHTGPMVFGHEFIGEVVAVGDEVDAVAVGDRIASGAGVWCGVCARCKEGRTNLCEQYYTFGLDHDGGLCEYVSVPVRTLVPLPDGISLDHAVLAQPLSVGLHAARRSRVRDGDRVVLFGAGAIGSFILAGLAEIAKDLEIIVVDFAGPRLDRALRIGATQAIPVGDGLRESIKAAFGGRLADVVIEASGASGQLELVPRLVRRGGTVLLVGLPTKPQLIDVHHIVMAEITVETTLAHVCDEDLAPSLEILATTNLGAELLDSVHPLEDVAEQLERLASGEVGGKVIFDPTR